MGNSVLVMYAKQQNGVASTIRPGRQSHAVQYVRIRVPMQHTLSIRRSQYTYKQICNFVERKLLGRCTYSDPSKSKVEPSIVPPFQPPLDIEFLLMSHPFTTISIFYSYFLPFCNPLFALRVISYFFFLGFSVSERLSSSSCVMAAIATFFSLSVFCCVSKFL